MIDWIIAHHKKQIRYLVILGSDFCVYGVNKSTNRLEIKAKAFYRANKN